MPKKLFFQLAEDKRARIRKAAIKEFAQWTYSESSTNKIVETAGISKGSLFKYFHHKKDLYFYVLDAIIAEFAESLDENSKDLHGDIVERTIQYAAFEFSWYIQNPENYGILKKAFAKAETAICREIEAKYALVGNNIFYELFEDMDAAQFHGKKQKTLDVLKWFLTGYNETFFWENHTQNNMNELKDKYLGRLVEYLDILKEGLR